MVFLSIYYKHKMGGYNQRLYRLFHALALRGNTVHYIATETFPVRHANIRRHILRAPFRSKTSLLFWFYFCSLAPLYSLWIAWRHRIDKIFVFSSFYSFICILPVMLARKKLVTFLRIDVVAESAFAKRSTFRNALNRLFEIIGLQLSSLVVTNSRSLMRSIARRNKNIKFALLPNNIEQACEPVSNGNATIRGKYKLSAQDFVIGTVSRLHPVKNIGFLIRAFSLVDSDNIRLVIVGEDSDGSNEKKRLKRLAAKLGQDERIVFTGWIDRPQRLVSAFDLFILPTLREGSPNSLLEALAVNVTCLGSQIPEITEILKNKELLFPLSSPKFLARKIQKIVHDPHYARRLNALCMKVKQRYMFDWEERSVAMLTQDEHCRNSRIESSYAE